MIDLLQMTSKHRVATLADWKQGEDVIIAGSVTDDEAKTIYPQHGRHPRHDHPIAPAQALTQTKTPPFRLDLDLEEIAALLPGIHARWHIS